MRVTLLTVSTFVVLATGACGADAQASGGVVEARRLFLARAESVLRQYDTVRSPDYYACAVQYARGTNDARTDANARALLAAPSGDVFWMLNATTLLEYGGEQMPPRVRAALRNAWRTYAPYRGDTGNHWCAYYTALYLVSEYWPDDPGTAWFDGRSSAEHRRDARDYLLWWIAETATDGWMEFDSPTYMPVYFQSVLLLRDFARDSTLRRAAGMMCDLTLAEFAANHLDGMYCGASSRVTDGTAVTPRRAAANGLAWLYFGAPGASRTQVDVACALSSYRPPDVVLRMATDRSRAYVRRARQRVRTVLRLGPVRTPPVCTTTYMTAEYALGSVPGGVLSPIQQRSWAFVAAGAGEHATIFGLHPDWSARELGMFFPEETETLLAQVTAAKGSYADPDKRVGASPDERIFQYRGTLVALYDIPPSAPARHVDGYFPKTLDTFFVDRSGWIVARAHRALLGWYPLAPAEVEDAVDMWRVRSRALRNGYVVETARDTSATSFDVFLQRLRSSVPAFDTAASGPRLRYRTLDGARFACAFDGTCTVDGKRVRVCDGRLDGPWLRSRYGSGVVTMTDGRKRVVYDFRAFRRR